MSRVRKIWLGLPPSHKSFRPYVTAIGQAAVAWNGLHEALRDIFWALTGANKATGSAIWYAIRSDRSQRGMIRAIAKLALETGGISDVVFKRVEWLLGECENLSNKRDEVIHAPLISTAKDGIYPNTFSGNPIAKRLLNKELLSEFRWCRDAGVTLTDFAMRLHLHMIMGDSEFGGLPEIPSMPNRGQKKKPPKYGPTIPRKTTVFPASIIAAVKSISSAHQLRALHLQPSITLSNENHPNRRQAPEARFLTQRGHPVRFQ